MKRCKECDRYITFENDRFPESDFDTCAHCLWVNVDQEVPDYALEQLEDRAAAQIAATFLKTKFGIDAPNIEVA
jgi:hypothetical protein